jgi:hypothetical protein
MTGGEEFIKVSKDFTFNNLLVTDTLKAPHIDATQLTVSSAPVNATDVVNKAYVDSLLSSGVIGPLSSTDTAIALFDGLTGTIIKNSAVTIDPLGNVSGINSITMNPLGTIDGRDISIDGTALDNHLLNTSNPHSTTKAQVGLSEVPNVKQNLSAITAPTLTDDSALNYSIGSRWVNTLTDDEYVCTDATPTSAVWKLTTATGGGSGNLLLSGNTISSTNVNGDINLTPNGSGQVLITPAPTAPTSAATKGYVDALIGGSTRATIALNDTTWTVVASALRGAGRLIFSVNANNFPAVVVDIGKTTSLSSFFSEFRSCNLYGASSTTINIRWNASTGVEAMTTGAAANTSYFITQIGF